MLTRIEALNYRSLRYVNQGLSRFHVLVGPNASGKTTFLDVAAFLADLLKNGVDDAIRSRTPDARDLLFKHRGDGFELGVEAAIPERFQVDPRFPAIRYEIRIGIDSSTSEAAISGERVSFVESRSEHGQERSLFPDDVVPPKTILRPQQGTLRIVTKSSETGKDNFYPEIRRGKGKGWVPSFQLGAKRSAFANLPEDETRFPVATWFKEFLASGVQQVVLDSLAMRKPSPPGQPRTFATDGTNLPWVVNHLRSEYRNRFDDWIAHVAEALEDVEDVETFERPEDRHRYIKLSYRGGLTIPSWVLSDGTLRLLALTLPAYLPDLRGAFLIEEPENGIHPRAIETVFQSLSHVYDAQILLATHSPVILSAAEPEQVLCFAKDSHGATDIVSGDKHPSLLEWRHETSLGVLFAAGVLG